MASTGRITIVNVGYRSTNVCVVSAATRRLLVDLGWPDTMDTMKANLARMDVPLRELRLVLAEISLAGEIVHTPGHSPDSVSLLLDDGKAFTGDLTHPMLIGADAAAETEASWQRLRDLGAQTVYPGHSAIRPI